MGIVPHEELVEDSFGFTGRKPAGPTDDSVLGAAFALENDVVAFIDYVGRDTFIPDPEFDLGERLRESTLYTASPNSYVGIQSEDEFNAVEARIADELGKRKTIADAGWYGIAASLSAGLLSPTILLPGGAAKGAGSVGKTAARTAGWGFVGMAVQEGVLYGSQETRTPAEVGVNIATGTILAGILGGSFKYITQGERAAVEVSMVDGDTGLTIRPAAPQAESLGAAKTDFEEANAGGLAIGANIGLNKISPVTRNLTQTTSETAKWMQAQLGNAGLRLEGNAEGIPTARGGDVETLAKQHEATYFSATRAVEQIFLKQSQSPLKSIPGLRMIGFKDFSEEVGRALERGGISDNPFVREAAGIYREQVYKPLLAQAQELGLKGFADITEEEAMTYLTRSVKTTLANRNYGDFVDVLAENFQEKLGARFNKKLSSVQKAEAETEQFITDLKLDDAGAQQVMDEMKEELAAIRQREAELAPVLNELKAARKAAKKAKSPRKKAKANKQLARIKKLNAEPLSEIAARKRVVANRKAALKARKGTKTAEDLAAIEVAKRGELEARTSRFAEDLAEYDGRIGKNGKVDFSSGAIKLAEDTAAKLMGETSRAPGISLILERGPELARMLDIDPTRVWSNGRTYEEFLDRDVDRLARTYVRSLGADLELHRKFGTVNPAAEQTEVGKKLAADFAAARRKIEADKKLTAKQREKALDKVADDIAAIKRDMQVQIDRIRHTRGMPEDPTHVGFRAGRAIMNLNVLRQMGTVIPSSIADLARPVMKFGLMDTFKDGWLPLVSNLKHLQMAKKEAQLAGTALDLVTHGRAAAMFDIFDDIEFAPTPVGKAERALQHATNKMGLVALFDFWNVGQKTVTSSIAMGKLSRATQALAEGRAGKEDIEFLAASYIDEPLAREIWRKTQESGYEQNGTWWPNTEDWLADGKPSSVEAVRAFRAALASNIDNTIITPGIERPNFVDMNTGARMLMQFRSFTLSSTQKTVMALGQDVRGGRAAQAAISINMSLALGALSYYTWAVSRGGDHYERMINADAGAWADEAIARSGLLGVLGEVHRFAGNTPGLAPYLTVSGAPTTRSVFGNSTLDMLGPSYSLGKDIGTIGMSFDEPTQRTANATRRIMPFNNVFYMSQLFTRIAEGK